MRRFETVASDLGAKNTLYSGENPTSAIMVNCLEMSAARQLRYGFDPTTLQILHSVARIPSQSEE